MMSKTMEKERLVEYKKVYKFHNKRLLLKTLQTFPLQILKKINNSSKN